MKAKKSYLEIIVTNTCNYDCSFCYGVFKPYRKETSTEEQCAKLAEALTNTEYDSIGFLGGEPLCNPQRLSALLEVAIKYAPNAPRRVFTAGSFLTPSLAFAFNELKVGLEWALQELEEGEKSLKVALSKAPNQFALLDAIPEFNDLSVRKVVDPFEEWAFKIYSMRQLIKKRISISLNYQRLSEFNIKAIYHFHKQLLLLRKLLPDFYEWFEVNSFISHHCSCDEFDVLHVDGELVGGMHTFPPGQEVCVLEKGCGMMSVWMGHSNYKVLNSLIYEAFQGGHN